MASRCSLKICAIFSLAFAFFMQGSLGNVECEKLDKDSCAFAISSSGKRCVLEKILRRSGLEAYTCRTSEIETEKLRDWVETDRCIDACGADRDTLGISSDALLDSGFTQKLCSPQCYSGCPNIVDLYFDLAAGEGVYLPQLCEEQGDSRRAMSEIKSSGVVAPGPVTAVEFVAAPALPPTIY